MRRWFRAREHFWICFFFFSNMLSYPILLSQILKYFWREKYQYLIYFVTFLDFRSFWQGKNSAGENWARQIRFSGRWNLSESKRFDHSRQFRIINSIQLLTELKQLATVVQTAGNVIKRIIRYPSNKMYWLDSNLRSSVLFFGGARKCGSSESRRSGEGRKKQRRIQLLHESSAASCLLTRCYLVSCF